MANDFTTNMCTFAHTVNVHVHKIHFKYHFKYSDKYLKRYFVLNKHIFFIVTVGYRNLGRSRKSDENYEGRKEVGDCIVDSLV